MTINTKKFKFALPKPEKFLMIVQGSLLDSLRSSNDATLNLAPLVQRAYTLVNEVGLLPYRDYDADVVFLEDKVNE